MANTTALKRGWHYDTSNSRLSAYVDGVEAIRITKSSTGADFRILGDTPATNYWNYDASGPTITQGGATIMNTGSSGSEVSYTAGTPLFTLYATCSSATSTNAQPFLVKSIMTGAGGYGGRSLFHAYTNAALTTNFMGLKSYAEFGDSGSVTGLAAGFCAEIKTPNADLGGGNFYPLELEYVAGGTSTASASGAGRVGWMYMNNTGDADGDFDDNGVLFDAEGLTAGSGHLYDTSASAATGDATLKIKINGTIKYLLVADDAS